MNKINGLKFRFKNWFKNLFKIFRPREKSNLEQFAEMELRIAGLYDEDSDYNGALADAVIELIKLFSKQHHSEFSAKRVIQLFNKLASFEPLTPLKGTDDEWVEYENEMYQNKRCSHVFKDGKSGQAYDIEGKIFVEPDGVCCYTDKNSAVFIDFPYIPKTEYINAPKSE